MLFIDRQRYRSEGAPELMDEDRIRVAGTVQSKIALYSKSSDVGVERIVSSS